MKKVAVLLGVVFAVLMGRMVMFSLAAHEGRIPQMPELSEFNNLAMFRLRGGADRIYEFVDGEKRAEGYLRFALADFNPSAFNLRIVVRSRPELLKSAMVRSAKSTWGGGVVDGDMAIFDISMKDTDSFLWSDGKCYVGISFPRYALRLGDTVELVSAKFSLKGGVR